MRDPERFERMVETHQPVLAHVRAQAQRPSRKAILVVEDDTDIRDLLVTLLRLADFDAHPCATAEEALRALRQRPFDLVLTDYALPGQTGGWMLRQASAEGLLGSTPALVVTAHPNPEDADDFEIIGKPFDLDDLVDCVRRHLGGSPALPAAGSVANV